MKEVVTDLSDIKNERIDIADADQKERMRCVLQFNKGFTHVDRWIEYALNHKFKRVKARKINSCPDCNGRSLTFIGQFIYYSTLVSLQKCDHCTLFFTDTRFAPEIIQAHFEHTYKDEKYFQQRRRRVFEQISLIADSHAPLAGTILDIGGAKGHLLATLKQRRSDLKVVLNDVSKEACKYAESGYGFHTVLGGIDALEKISTRFDVVILSDVIYYEPELRRLWAVLPRLVSENGAVLIRVPNKIALIRSWQFLRRIFGGRANNEMQDTIHFFNPEHLFVFSRNYLSNRLRRLGFQNVIATPSKLLIQGNRDFLTACFYLLSRIIWLVSFGKIVITPSLIVIAKHYAATKNNEDTADGFAA